MVKPAPIEVKRLIRIMYLNDQVLDTIFYTVLQVFGNNVISRKHVQKLIGILGRGNRSLIEKTFRDHPAVHNLSTRSRHQLSVPQKHFLFGLRGYYVTYSYRDLHKLFIEAWYGNFDLYSDRFSENFLRLACVAEGFKQKVLETRNFHASVGGEVRFLRVIEHVHETQIVSIDGMKQGRNDFKPRRGYGRLGKRVVNQQISIRIGSFAVMIACTMRGIIAYQIFGGNVGQEEIGYFIDYVLAPKIFKYQYAILDNAKNQDNPYVRSKLEQLFDGRYAFLSSYSPHFAPVETVIGNVKDHIRRCESRWPHKTEEELLIDSLDHYSVSGPGGSSAANQFNVYKNNHNLYLQNCAVRAAAVNN